MLSQRSINRIGRHLENEGWSEEEINEAINEIDHAGGVLNIALPLHFKEEALQHAKCHCKYVLRLKEGSAKYKKAFEDAYSTYLIEAFENSRGVEGPNSGSHRKANPAGIEVFAFDKISKSFIPEKEKSELGKKAHAGLIYMGLDGLLQDSIAKMDKKIDKDLIKDIVTQYSASVVSLANTFLYAFGGYKTKRKYSGKRIYNQDEQGNIDTEGTLEFTKNKGTDEDKKKMLEVAYRQITRQLYIIALSSILSSATSLDEEIVKTIEKTVEQKIKEMWIARGRNDEINLAFVLKRETRNAIINDFFSKLNKNIFGYDLKKTKSALGEDLEITKSSQTIRDQFIDVLKNTIKSWSEK